MSGRPLRIFISYRRSESEHVAGRLAEWLSHRRNVSIFIDVDMDPGINVRQAIDKSIRDSDVLLVVIGPKWLTVVDETGRRRLSDAADLVAFEVATGLAHATTVVPILVDGATMPRKSELPPELGGLSGLNAISIDATNFRSAARRLLTVLDALPTRPTDNTQYAVNTERKRSLIDTRTGSSARPRKIGRLRIAGAAAALLLVFAIVAYMASTPRERDGTSVVHLPDLLLTQADMPAGYGEVVVEKVEGQDPSFCNIEGALNAISAPTDFDVRAFRKGGDRRDAFVLHTVREYSTEDIDAVWDATKDHLANCDGFKQDLDNGAIANFTIDNIRVRSERPTVAVRATGDRVITDMTEDLVVQRGGNYISAFIQGDYGDIDSRVTRELADRTSTLLQRV